MGSVRIKHVDLFFVFGVLLLGLGHAQQEANRGDMVMKCFTERNCITKRTGWDHLMKDRPSCLTAARVWWSAMPSAVPVTLITQLTIERLDNLRAQCAFWHGPLAAALYVPLINPTDGVLSDENAYELQQIVDLADKLFNSTEENAASCTPGKKASSSSGGPGSGCQLRLMLIYELFEDARGTNMLYPVNSLRNYARMMADTDLITNIDVDMIPSMSISNTLADAALLAEYTAGCRAGATYVFPAFEAHCGGTTFADTVAMGPRTGIPDALKTCLRTMRPQAPFSHNSTNYTRWFGLLQDEINGVVKLKDVRVKDAYPIKYGSQFEPWVLSWRWHTPWYDFRYRGYGYNKIVQVAAMNATGIAWFVSPHGFLVHRPHIESLARKDFLKTKLRCKDAAEMRGSMFEHVEILWAESQRELVDGTYAPWVEDDFKACMDSLPWWRDDGGRSVASRYKVSQQQAASGGLLGKLRRLLM